jgi:hypothetical protein
LLDAGPIIKLFELGIWDKFIEKCDVTITRTIVEQCIYTGRAETLEYINFPFEEAAEKGQITIVDVKPSDVKDFIDARGLSKRFEIHSGEDETLAFLNTATEDYRVCAADGAVFRVLGFIGKGEQGVSLEELLKAIGLSGNLEWRFTKKFCDRYTAEGKIDAAQGI